MVPLLAVLAAAAAAAAAGASGIRHMRSRISAKTADRVLHRMVPNIVTVGRWLLRCSAYPGSDLVGRLCVQERNLQYMQQADSRYENVHHVDKMKLPTLQPAEIRYQLRGIFSNTNSVS